MLGGGRLNASGKSPVMDERRLNLSFYSSIHRCKVTDLYFEKGTVQVDFIDGGAPREVPLPLIGFSLPPKMSENDKNYLRASWGVYYPQVDDILNVGFDMKGNPRTLGYDTIDFAMLKRSDDANEARGGIGWADASGKRLRSGDWSFKSARNSALYLGDKAQISSGPHSITLDKSTVNGQIGIRTSYLHTYYGMSSERREGNARRILVPGVDAQESPVMTMTGLPAQEWTNVVKRSSIISPAGQTIVHIAEGEVIDELTRIQMIPVVAHPDLAIALVGLLTRSYKTVKDDAKGVVDLYTQVIDNLGNYGVSAKTSTGFQWNTPAAMWTILNANTNWTSSVKLGLNAGVDLSLMAGVNMSMVAGALMNLTSTGAMKLTAPSISLATGVISLGASPVAMQATDSLLIQAGSGLNLMGSQVALGGTAGIDFLVKGTMFKVALDIFLAAVTAAGASAADPVSTTAAVKAIGVAAGVFQTSAASMLSTVSKTV